VQATFQESDTHAHHQQNFLFLSSYSIDLEIVHSQTMSGKTNPTTRRLASSIVKFLQDSQKNGTLDSEDAESMEVAVTIISESFGLDTTPVEPVNLVQVFDVYEKTRERMVSLLLSK